jgi:hypothetical protein
VTMKSFRYPSKGSEVAFCRLRPDVKDCKNGHGFDPERHNIPMSSLEVKTSSLGENVGRGVFAKRHIPQNSYIGLDKLIPPIYVSPYAYDISTELNKISLVYSNFYGKKLETYANVYGHYFSRHVSRRFLLLLLFLVNFCCKSQNSQKLISLLLFAGRN